MQKMNVSVKTLILDIKKRHKSISCRSIANILQSQYHLKVSKSSVNNLLKAMSLSGPIGRPVSRSFRASGTVKGAGYVFLLGSDYLLQFSKRLVEWIVRFVTAPHMRRESLEAACQTLIIGKAFFNVPTAKWIEYRKDELWPILGRKTAKSLLVRFSSFLTLAQPIREQLVKDFSSYFRDIQYIKVILANNQFYFLDGQFKSIWSEAKNNIPIDFCVTYYVAERYITDHVIGDTPWVFFDFPLNAVGQNLFAIFLASFLYPETDYCIKSFQFIDIKGDIIFSHTCSQWNGKKFLAGVEPGQVDFFDISVDNNAWQRYVNEEIEKDIYFTEKRVIFPQHVINKEVTLRLFLLKSCKTGAVERGILTNMNSVDMDDVSIIKAYVQKCPDFNKTPEIYRNTLKNPSYLENFIAMEKIFSRFQKIQHLDNTDDILSIFVEILELFAKRSFFNDICQRWSFLKIKELVFKKEGCLRRDTREFISYNIFINNMLYDSALLKEAVLRFNEQPLFDTDGRKLWLALSTQKE